MAKPYHAAVGRRGICASIVGPLRDDATVAKQDVDFYQKHPDYKGYSWEIVDYTRTEAEDFFRFQQAAKKLRAVCAA